MSASDENTDHYVSSESVCKELGGKFSVIPNVQLADDYKKLKFPGNQRFEWGFFEVDIYQRNPALYG